MYLRCRRKFGHAYFNQASLCSVVRTLVVGNILGSEIVVGVVILRYSGERTERVMGGSDGLLCRNKALLPEKAEARRYIERTHFRLLDH